MNENYAGASKKGVAFLNILAFLLVLIVNSLAVYLPLNGKTTGQISDLYPNLFTPAGFTFSVWSLIYVFLLGFTIYQAIVLFNVQHPSRAKILRITWPFIISCLANAGWIVSWHYEQVILSAGIILVLLVSLISIHKRLSLALPATPVAEKLWLDFPFSLYLGWISIATIANFTALLVYLQWDGLGISPTTWTIIMVSLGTLLNLYMIFLKKNIAFALVGIWAFYGIMVKSQTASVHNINKVIFCAELCITMIAFSIILQVARRWIKSANDNIENKKEMVEPEI